MSLNLEGTAKQEPHRVIYTCRGKQLTRVFANYEQAEEFAKTVVDAVIQPATTKPNLNNRVNRQFNTKSATQNTTVYCQCGSRKKRLRADAHCVMCCGVLSR